jgi:3',5'-cyclic AMP phosphodiesterase CpdA
LEDKTAPNSGVPGGLKGKRRVVVGQAMKKWLRSMCGSFVVGAGLLVAGLPAGAAEPYFFIQLSDPQFGMFTGNKDFVQETANFEFAVATINRLRPKFVVITGDLINKPGDAAQIAEFKRIAAKVDSAIPVHNVAGNHDVENVPTPDLIASYTNGFGPDRYVFRHDGFAGLVLNSSVIHSPQKTTNEYAAQEQWLRAELERVRTGGAQHIVIFQHHPWFLKTADEADQYFNIPKERRAPHLALFREFGVKYLFSGHYHRNAVARDGDLEAVTTGPVGQPQGGDKSGLRVVIVRDGGLEHRYYHFGELPNRIDLAPAKPSSKGEN